jgi:hypothetical protein
MIDLDKANIKEFNGELYNFESQFKFTRLYGYSQDKVGSKRLIKIHCRGSSRKEAIDNNNKLIVFFLHQNKLYQWTEISINK